MAADRDNNGPVTHAAAERTDVCSARAPSAGLCEYMLFLKKETATSNIQLAINQQAISSVGLPLSLHNSTSSDYPGLND